MQYTHTEKCGDLTIRICYDEDGQNPRTDYDNFGKMACWHRHYVLGDKHSYAEPADLKAALPKGSVVLPLYLYDHGGITIKAGSGFSCPWDSGQLGYVYATPEMIRKEYSVKRITKALRAKIEKLLIAETETYDCYLRGEIYGFMVEDTEGECLASCWGFLGDQDYCLSEARDIAKHYQEKLNEEKARGLEASRPDMYASN